MLINNRSFSGFFCTDILSKHKQYVAAVILEFNPEFGTILKEACNFGALRVPKTETCNENNKTNNIFKNFNQPSKETYRIYFIQRKYINQIIFLKAKFDLSYNRMFGHNREPLIKLILTQI